MSGAVVVAGGGTAGHVTPALAVAEALVTLGVARGDVHLVGARRGMEATLVPPSGFPLTLLDLRNFPRRITPVHLVSAARLVGGLGRAFGLLGRLRPRAVLSVGGYASVPTVAAAWLRRVPIIVLSYDAVPGLASRLAARVATACAVAFPSSPLPRQVLTGAPIAPALVGCEPDRDRAAARVALELPADRSVVLVVGGSLGSGKLNELTTDLLRRWSGRRDLAVRLVTGTRNAGAAPPTSDGADGPLVQVVAYEDHMEHAYAAADLVLARAGATTVAELAALGLPSVLVPWPLAAEDHQTANARWLADAGGCTLLAEKGLTVDVLAAEIERLLGDREVRSAMATAARTVGRRDAAQKVAELVLTVGRPS